MKGAATVEERNLRKTRTGKVVSDKMDKTIVVAVEDLSLIHISEPTRRQARSRMPSSA